MVIGIISLIILTALLALEAVTEQRRLTQAVTDVANIRSAMSKYATRGMLVYPPVDDGTGNFQPTARDLRWWSQISGLLPGQLGIIAETTNRKTLERANPWSLDYTFGLQVEGGSIWCLGIQGVPKDLALVLVKQLLLNGAQSAWISRNPANPGSCAPASQGPPGFSSTAVGDTSDIFARYEE